MDVKTVASKVVGQMANTAVPFSGPVAESLVQELLGAQDEQIERLRKVGGQLDRLRDGPWNAARMYLKEAALPGRSSEQVASALRDASGQLHLAIPLQEPGSLERAQVNVDLAITERMRGDSELAGLYALDAYRQARAAMGSLVQNEYRRSVPERPDRLAKLIAAGSLYAQIELAAAVIGDRRAPQILSFAPDGSVGMRFNFDSFTEIKWTASEPLDLAYLAYFQYLVKVIRDAEGRAPIRLSSLDILCLRFANPEQVQNPEYRPLPPMVELEDVNELAQSLMILAAMGKLP